MHKLLCICTIPPIPFYMQGKCSKTERIDSMLSHWLYPPSNLPEAGSSLFSLLFWGEGRVFVHLFQRPRFIPASNRPTDFLFCIVFWRRNPHWAAQASSLIAAGRLQIRGGLNWWGPQQRRREEAPLEKLEEGDDVRLSSPIQILYSLSSFLLFLLKSLIGGSIFPFLMGEFAWIRGRMGDLASFFSPLSALLKASFSLKLSLFMSHYQGIKSLDGIHGPNIVYPREIDL